MTTEARRRKEEREDRKRQERWIGFVCVQRC